MRLMEEDYQPVTDREFFSGKKPVPPPDNLFCEDYVDQTLKFQHLIDAAGLTCELIADCQAFSGNAYRFTDGANLTEDDFLPTIIIDQRRKISRKVRKGEDICRWYAISLYDSLESAESAFDYLSVRYVGKWSPKIICEGMLEDGDGVATVSDLTGHFSFFEYKAASIYQKFGLKIIKL